MTKKKYVRNLVKNGFRILDDNHVALGSLVFKIREAVSNTLSGDKPTFAINPLDGSVRDYEAKKREVEQ